MNDLFAAADQNKRLRLAEHGWTPVGCPHGGPCSWRTPDDNATVCEAEAFAWLERRDRAEEARGGHA